MPKSSLKPQEQDRIKDVETGPVDGEQAVNINYASDAVGEVFPPVEEQARLDAYEYFERIFLGDHFNAFRIKINDDDYNKEYGRLRYVKINMAGLISKVAADFLFSEPIKLKAPEEGDQEFIDALAYENKMDEQLYESALSNSYNGDAVFKIRIGPRDQADSESTVIIEDITPSIYFPEINRFNVRATPKSKTLAWVFNIGKDKYLRKEIHEGGKIFNKVYKMKGDKIEAEVDLSILNSPDIKPVVDTKITKSLIVHIPNWKIGRRYYGLSDFYDLDAIFYAINNRMTMVDNVLDKHTDPILAVPDGIFDEDGKVKKDKFNMIELPLGAGDEGKPEYIVWDASLENAFSEVDKLVEFLFMTSETSPDVLGMGKGQSDSGRALKLKILRTLAKIARKKIYYNRALQEVFYVAQLMAKAHGVKVGGLTLKGEPTIPEIIWSDGLPIDELEQVEIEVKRVDAGLQDKASALMNIDGIEEADAEDKAKKIKDETTLDLPKMDFSGNSPFSKKPDQKGQ